MKPISEVTQSVFTKFSKIPKIVTQIGEPPRAVTVYFLILIPATFLMITGFFMIFSAKTIKELGAGADPYLAHSRTAIIMAGGFIAMMITSRFKVETIRKLSIIAFVLALMLQTLLFPFGKRVNGNLNWVEIGPLPTFQPSEALKLGLTLMLAYSFACILRNRRDMLPIMVWVVTPIFFSIAFIMYSEDLGTALVIIALAVGVITVAGMPREFYQISLIVGVLGITAAVLQKPSRIERILRPIGLGTPRDPNAPEQIDYSLRALGSGGLTGVGAGASKEKWFSLPAAETDFIFAVLGEEFGFLGTASVVLVFIAFFYGMFRLALSQTDLYKRLVVVGMLSWMGMQTLINLGTVTGYGPIIGVPLPFISHGGTSFIITAVCVGVVLSIAREAAGFNEKNRFGKVLRRQLS
ncbi:FtsW/RodA/SpoVE family cell cycle protein [Gleimia sp. 6138-11-ORH1]|uniref:FtsW/RodA/SpoVE family cell cycle protein n=1 Tax=Gleimia sp. 6138-11-ORH1 TaxID=2973937 RepID=UPI00216A6E49|nr:FtsW/RodA/SpoVE family cell cycle protein [Gleimia sp. 6138-11-ORH1]MCS4484540.1 FtsW/RodA/SpoVE family cell cycle protein [Gleimia sp. 6138-11-ORH1]